MVDENIEDVSDAEEMTVWRNPTDTVQSFRLLREDGKFKTYSISPGKAIKLEKVYDDGIQQVLNGVIVGGHAPLLVKEKVENAPLHPCLDYKKVAEHADLLSLAAEINQQEALKKAIAMKAELMKKTGK